MGRPRFPQAIGSAIKKGAAPAGAATPTASEAAAASAIRAPEVEASAE